MVYAANAPIIQAKSVVAIPMRGMKFTTIRKRVMILNQGRDE